MDPIISVVVVLIIVGLVLWGVGQLPIDPSIMRIIRVVVVIAAVLWVLRAFGLFRGLPG